MADKDYKGKDKAKHFWVCFIISVFSTQFALGLALGKEQGDKNAAGNHWCWWDIAADVSGIVCGTAIRVAYVKWFFGWPMWVCFI